MGAGPFLMYTNYLYKEMGVFYEKKVKQYIEKVHERKDDLLHVDASYDETRMMRGHSLMLVMHL